MAENGVTEKLRTMVAELSVRGVERLPPERELASVFGVARATVSKGISLLEGESLLERRQGSGTYIKAVRRDNGVQCVGLGLRYSFDKYDTHFSRIINGLSSAAKANSVNLHIFDRLEDQLDGQNFSAYFHKMKENNLLHGMIIASRMPLSVVAAIQRELPLVILNNKIGNGEICCVDCDYVRAAWLAVSHLIKAGHRRIVFVYESVSHPELWQHQSGYRLAFETNDLKSPEIFLSAGVNEELFERNIINFFSSNKDVTALYTRHNLTAERIIKTLGGMGIRIPDDISVVTTGDFENCRLPGGAVISCADTRIGEMCSIAMETVAMEMRGRKINENWNILEPEFKAGDTVKNI